MKSGIKVIIGIVVALAIVVLPLMGSYNSLVNEESNVELAWSQVEAQLQRRNDLIPNLVNSVQGAMDQEQEVFGDIANARAQLGGANTLEEEVEANNEISSALSRLLVVIENYPEIRSNENVTALMDELAGTENRITQERRRYNESVQQYNNRVRRFPGSIVAGMFGFDSKPYFEAVEGAETPPEVNFDESDE